MTSRWRGTRHRIAAATLAATTAAVVVAGAAAPAQAASNTVPETLFSSHVFGTQDSVWHPGSVPIGSVRIWDNGAAWTQVETARDVYDWSKLDAAVATAEAHGAQVLYVLGQTPTWASAAPTGPGYLKPGDTQPPASMSDWTDWVTEVATKYRGRIDAYQIWNEGNLSTFFTGTPAQMADLTKAGYDAVKAADPGATVVAASTTTRLASSFVPWFKPYLRELRKRNWPVDVFSGHFYPSGSGTPTTRLTFIAKFKKLLRSAKAPNRPIWETEINYGLAGPGTIPHRDITGSAAKAYVAQTLLGTQWQGLARTYWFGWSGAAVPLFGIQMTPGSDAATAWSTVYGWLAGERWRGCVQQGKLITCKVGSGSGKATIVWTKAGSASVKAPRGATEACAVDQCRSVRPKQAVKVSMLPVRFDA